MVKLKVGSLFSGVGGLDLAVEQFFDAETLWHAEFDPAPSKVLARRWPGVPNLGDVTKVDWSEIPKVNIICGGSPCQDISGAGKRAGMTEGTRSNLWVQMREAIAAIRPQVVVWENVGGAYSAHAFSEVESESGLLGEYGPDRPALRALGRVLGDLATLGYDAEWGAVRASDAGAAHHRARVFVIAYAPGFRGERDWASGLEPRHGSTEGRRYETDADTDDSGGAVGTVSAGPEHAPVERDGVEPVTDSVGASCEGDGAVRRETEYPVVACDCAASSDSGGGGGHERGDAAGVSSEGSDGSSLVDGCGSRSRHTQWGIYGPAIHRWEAILGRVAPPPTLPDGRGGAHRLSARFVEFLMGFDDGWVTDPALGLTRNSQLRALGNGVVTAQCVLALRLLWPRVVEQ